MAIAAISGRLVLIAVASLCATFGCFGQEFLVEAAVPQFLSTASQFQDHIFYARSQQTFA
jgi:hypothetical protein